LQCFKAEQEYSIKFFRAHVHMLRHAAGYALAARGMDTRRLQHFLGHASITNTVRYTAMSPEPFKDVWR
jgi:site-specific recombinase XerD